jgi:predicted nucleic acid-binding protein
VADLLDTSAALSIVERRDASVRSLVAQASERFVRSCTVLGELCHGAAMGDEPIRQATVEAYRQLTDWREIDRAELSEIYGDVMAESIRLGIRIGPNDCWIIAEAAAAKSRLITFDTKQARLARSVLDDPDDVVLLTPANENPVR